MKLFSKFLEETNLKNIGLTGLTDELFSVLLKEIQEEKNKGRET